MKRLLLAISVAILTTFFSYESHCSVDGVNQKLSSQLLKSEYLFYENTNVNLKVAFYRSSVSMEWTMTVRDSRRGSELFRNDREIENRQVAADSVIRTLEAAWTCFNSDRPNSLLNSINIEMDVAREFWSALKASLVRNAPNWDPFRVKMLGDVPPEAEEWLQGFFEKAPFVRQIHEMATKMGYSIKSTALSEQIIFRITSDTETFQDLVKQPDQGIRNPGTLEFAIERKR